ncbi:PLP-dependent aminotransferase family protein [Paenibacillus rigui]|uniref:Aminotransferase 4 n=1 Tax=Paenibacillus rigui TaxID=554312 RepID=A0A229ULK3_9BACL|nr:PLP-dependent aminotransferase family protein [Paenibacillus rigui]OXM84296.1 aminotransferase 4 [Paenibacillus rigui]
MTTVLQPFPYAKRVPAVTPMGAAQASSSSDVIPFSYGTPTSDAFPYDGLKEAALKAILDHGRDALQYAGAGGPQVVKEWIAQRSALRSIDVTTEQVLVTYGSQQAIDYAARTLLEPGDHAWVEAPTYFGAVSTFRSSEALITSFPIDEDGLQVDLIEKALEEAVRRKHPLPKLVYCMPNFQNPGGVVLSLERRRKLAELAYQYNFFILEDDAYVELTFTGKHLPAIYSFAPERVIYLSTFSKIIAPGIRLGWAIGSSDVIRRMNTFFQGSKASVFSQEIAAQLLQHLPFDDHLEALASRYRSSRDVMVDSLKANFGEEVSFQVPEGGFFIWLTFPEDVDTGRFVQDAYERGVSFIDGSKFFVRPEGARHARLSFSYCTEEQIRRGVRLLAEAYQAYQASRTAN